MENTKHSSPANDPYRLIKPESEWTVDVRGSIANGGGTGQEYPKCLYSDSESAGSKWMDNRPGETWVTAKFIEEQPVYLVQIKSANDSQGRDPYKIVVYADGEIVETWDKIIFEKRFETKSFFLDQIKNIKNLKLAIVKNRNHIENGSFGDGTQIAQLKFYKLAD